jgi:hypothetical protein
MSVRLRDVLTLVGRLDDGPGSDTPRDRFRRFIDDRVLDVDAARELLRQCQEALGDQHARARQDLIIVLGRFLGFDAQYGTYDPRQTPRISGQWRSRRRVRIVLDIRSEQTPGFEVDDLARTVAALSAAAVDGDEPCVGLCVTTPFYAARRRLEALLAARDRRDVRCVSVASLLWLADAAAAGRIEHADVVRLLTSGPDSDFMIDLMRRLTESAGSSRAAAAATVSDAVAADATATPGERADEANGAADEADRESGFWLAHLSSDENASPDLVLESVIRRRQVLGIGDAAGFPPAARPGDWVCFHIDAVGIAGHAQLASVIADASALIRGAARFSAVFRLQHVAIYQAPSPVAPDSTIARLVARRPAHSCGAFLSAISRTDYELATGAAVATPRTAAS